MSLRRRHEAFGFGTAGGTLDLWRVRSHESLRPVGDVIPECVRCEEIRSTPRVRAPREWEEESR
jgi:hypothetical protein